MADPVETMREHLRVVAAVDRGQPAGLAAIGQLDDADLVRLLPAVQALVTSAQGLLALTGGEIAARRGDRHEPALAQGLGYRTAAGLVADRANLGYGDAHRLVDLGRAIRPTGPAREPERPHIAEAVLAGALPLQLAAVIDRTLAALHPRLSGHDEDLLEAVLVEQATSGEVSVKQFTRDCSRLVERQDPAGSKHRDDALRARASYRETQLSNGLLRIVAELDPERAAYYRAAMTARTNPQRADGDSAAEAPNRAPQPDATVRKLDAFTAIMRDDLARDDGVQAGVATTVLVRIGLQDLVDGVGTATIDGIDTPVSGATARRMAVEADVIPQVFGGKGQLLDQGEARRLFSKAQRYAIYAGHDGCAFPGCDLPLSMTQLHHIGSWATRSRHRRGTDLANGIPLCGFHNRLMEAGWTLELDADGTPWFTPPDRVDPERRPVRGNARRYERAA